MPCSSELCVRVGVTVITTRPDPLAVMQISEDQRDSGTHDQIGKAAWLCNIALQPTASIHCFSHPAVILCWLLLLVAETGRSATARPYQPHPHKPCSPITSLQLLTSYPRNQADPTNTLKIPLIPSPTCRPGSWCHKAGALLLSCRTRHAYQCAGRTSSTHTLSLSPIYP